MIDKISVKGAIANRMKTQTIRTAEQSKIEAKRLLQQMAEMFDTNQSLQQMIGQLQGYEQQYDLSTVEFYPQFIAGTLGDSRDFLLWASLYETYVELAQPHLIAQSAA